MNPALIEQIDKLKQEFNQSLPAAPNYSSLKHKLSMLQDMSRAQSLSGNNSRVVELKEEINKRFKELIERDDIKQKMEELEAEIGNSGMSGGMKEKIVFEG